jgi:hypothetical protein
MNNSPNITLVSLNHISNGFNITFPNLDVEKWEFLFNIFIFKSLGVYLHIILQ